MVRIRKGHMKKKEERKENTNGEEWGELQMEEWEEGEQERKKFKGIEGKTKVAVGRSRKKTIIRRRIARLCHENF